MYKHLEMTIYYKYSLGTRVDASGDFAHTFFTCQMQNHWKSSDRDYCCV